jgi:hypothetical protein
LDGASQALITKKQIGSSMITHCAAIFAKSTWAEIRTACASGIGLREIARNMNIPEGTVLATSKTRRHSQSARNLRLLSLRLKL